MLLLGQKLWIILILYIDSFLPMGCEAAIENEQTKIGDKDNPHKFPSKPIRRLLDWRDTTDYDRSSDTSNRFIYIVIVCVIVLLATLIKCCMKLAEGADDTDANNSNAVVHPPPRNHFMPSQSTSSFRPLAPPMTNSRSLILIPEEGGIFQAFHIGIENPNYIATNSTTDNPPSYAGQQPNKSNNPTALSDLPPSYETVVIEDMLNDAGERIASAAAVQNGSTSTVLPRYGDSRY